MSLHYLTTLRKEFNLISVISMSGVTAFYPEMHTSSEIALMLCNL